MKNSQIIKRVAFHFLFLLAHIATYSQVEIFGGANHAFIRHQSLVGSTRPIQSPHWGIGITVYPVRDWSKFSISTNLLFTVKGYEQKVNKELKFELYYTAFQLIANYKLTEVLGAQAGLEYATYGGCSVSNSDENYRTNDLGLLVGFTVFPEKRLSIYSQCIWGLLPIVDYYEIDASGNFKGRIRDVRNTCFSVSLKIKITKQKYYVW